MYILLGDDLEADGELAVYVGEGDEIRARLREHARTAQAGGKDFWDRVVMLTSKDANLTKAHARYLESRLIAFASAARRARLINNTSPVLIQLPEADIADMEYYLSQVQIILPVLGITAFRPAASAGRVVHATEPGAPAHAHESPIFTFRVPLHNVLATAREIDGEFTVLAGSTARSSWMSAEVDHSYGRLHAPLLEDGTLEIQASGLAQFTRDTAFSSPSAAASLAAGRVASGRTDWIDLDSGSSFGAWQSRDLA